MADSSHKPCPPDFFDIFAQLLAEVVKAEVDSSHHCYCAWGRWLAGAAGRGAAPVVAGDGVEAVRAGGM